MTYAAKTEVPVDRSKSEIERTLARYGASKYFTGWDHENAVVGFHMSDRIVQFRLPLPAVKDYRTTKMYEQAIRTRWRALLLCIKAKLESVEAGIETFEEAFLAHVLISDGMGGTQTIGEVMIPQIEVSYRGGSPQLALPSG